MLTLTGPAETGLVGQQGSDLQFLWPCWDEAIGAVPEELGCGQASREESSLVSMCLRRIRRWRVPPRWSNRDWIEEMRAEAAAAALQAAKDFDPSRGVPREAFLRQRIMHAALARYRREWNYAIRQASVAALDEYGKVRGGGPFPEASHKLLHEALRQLPAVDARLIEALFWGGETEAELGQCLGISQQAVSKRKKKIFQALRQTIDIMEN